MQVQQVIRNLNQQLTALAEAGNHIGEAIKVLETVVPNGVATTKRKEKAKKGTRKPMSAAARKKIGDAARARWAAKKAAGK